MNPVFIARRGCSGFPIQVSEPAGRMRPWRGQRVLPALKELTMPIRRVLRKQVAL